MMIEIKLCLAYKLVKFFRFDVDKGGSIDSEELGSLVRVLG
jgi:Ca2+-binding EF-hand superfamily protein